MQPKITCPLGGVCTEIKNNELFQCAWYCEMSGRNPQTGVEENKKGCAMAFLPLLMVENVGAMRGMQASNEAFRNGMVGATVALADVLSKAPVLIPGGDY